MKNRAGSGDEPELGGNQTMNRDVPTLGGGALLARALEALDSGQDGLIWRAGEALMRMGADAVPYAIQHLEHPDYRVRAVAARTLLRLASDRASLAAVPALAQRLNDPSELVRAVARGTLVALAEHHPAEAGTIQREIEEETGRLTNDDT